MNVRYRQTAALWSQVGYPTFENEHALRQKIENAAAAGFDSIQWDAVPGLEKMLADCGLDLLGYVYASDFTGIAEKVDRIVALGATHATMQLGTHDSESQRAVDVMLEMVAYARTQGLTLTVETHRTFCTETPEKFVAIADGYFAASGEHLPVTWDFSHHAVVKHMMPDEWRARLLDRPAHVQASRVFHCRPFNGHHVQVPVTNPDGSLTVEVQRYLGFVESLFRLWLTADKPQSEIWVCPEMGPADEMGYNLHCLPNSWTDAKVLRVELRRVWQSVVTDLAALPPPRFCMVPAS